ncbi:hypothetical protein YUMDRAFT_06024 [Streptomyces sp. OspMP-M45]|nr:hypothetical protein YUMDRAFT_06024 [Streptomyces sp. OspMP-M45]
MRVSTIAGARCHGMNEFTQQVQDAYDRGGKGEARKVFLDTCLERDWTKDEIVEAITLYRSFPIREEAGHASA